MTRKGEKYQMPAEARRLLQRLEGALGPRAGFQQPNGRRLFSPEEVAILVLHAAADELEEASRLQPGDTGTVKSLRRAIRERSEMLHEAAQRFGEQT